MDVEIERILPGGAGLAHARGQTVMVSLAAPGDRARVRVDRIRGTVAFASIVEIRVPSPARVVPRCRYFGRCGGCDFQQLSYEAQLAAKVDIIRDCLRRIARIDPPAELTITGSPAAWGYRARAQWQYDPGTKRLGYFARGTHEVCDVAECPVLVPSLQRALAGLRDRVPHEGLAAGAGEFQAAAGDDDVSLIPPCTPYLSREVVCTIGAERYRYDAERFFQSNQALLGPLIAAAAGTAAGEMALDLYCGVGLFTLPLARRFRRVVGVEADPPAVAYARRNVRDAGLTNATIEESSVGQWLARHAVAHPQVDLALLDPPRSGAESETVQGLLAWRPRLISYVSCDPATLARDLRRLIEGGYHLEQIAAFDLFPQTHHVEMVARLSR